MKIANNEQHASEIGALELLFDAAVDNSSSCQKSLLYIKIEKRVLKQKKQGQSF